MAARSTCPRIPLRPRLAAGAVAGVGLAAVFALFLVREAQPDEPPTPGPAAVALDGDGGHTHPTVQAVAVTGYASAAIASLARETARGERVAALAATTRRGDTPVAVVTRRTGLRAKPDGHVIERLGTETEFGSPRVHAIVAHEGDWLEVLSADLPNGRTGWIAADDVEVGGVAYSLHAGLDERMLEVRRRGEVVRRMEIAVGGPATPTPTGTFAVTDKLRMTGEGSPYGCCVLAFSGRQPNVPQGWSGGDRLAVHATPDEATIGQPVSLGCFRARERDMEWLLEHVPLGAPVVVSR